MQKVQHQPGSGISASKCDTESFLGCSGLPGEMNDWLTRLVEPSSDHRLPLQYVLKHDLTFSLLINQSRWSSGLGFMQFLDIMMMIVKNIFLMMLFRHSIFCKIKCIDTYITSDILRNIKWVSYIFCVFKNWKAEWKIFHPLFNSPNTHNN